MITSTDILSNPDSIISFFYTDTNYDCISEDIDTSDDLYNAQED